MMKAMKQKMLALGALVLVGVAAPRPAAAGTFLSFGFGFRPCPPAVAYGGAHPYPYAVFGGPVYYPPVYPYYYPYYPAPTVTVGGYYSEAPYFRGRDEGIRSYTLPGYRGWYR
jgi:hypothetical protein